MRIEYDLLDAGWAEARIVTAERAVCMTVSYLHDSLRQLAEAAIHLSEGAARAEVIFMDEPGEHQLIFERTAADQLRVEIRWYDDWASWNMHPQSQYDRVAEFTTFVSAFRAEVARVLATLLQKYGEVQYKEKWVEHDFPKAEYERLRAV